MTVSCPMSKLQNPVIPAKSLPALLWGRESRNSPFSIVNFPFRLLFLLLAKSPPRMYNARSSPVFVTK